MNIFKCNFLSYINFIQWVYNKYYLFIISMYAVFQCLVNKHIHDTGSLFQAQYSVSILFVKYITIYN